MSAEIAAKDAFLVAMLPNIMFDGWSMTAMREVQDHGDMRHLFPGGVGEVAQWLDDWADRQMLARLAAMDLAVLKTRARVAAGVMARLAALAPHREAVRRAIARRATPFGALGALRATYRTVDAIWYAAGDTATDFNFYTKRGLLAAAYAATLFYWLDDSSEQAEDSRQFLDRRLDEVMRLPRLTQKVKGVAGNLASSLSALGQIRR